MLILSQSVHVAAADAAETHHAVHHEAGLDYLVTGDDPAENRHMHSLHDAFHCGGHFAAPSDSDIVGMMPTPTIRLTQETNLYLSLATVPPVPPPLILIPSS